MSYDVDVYSGKNTKHFSWTADVYFEDGNKSHFFDQEDGILMQYTGLKDKNGKEIYEGDVVKVMCDDDEESAVTQEVKWSKWGGYFCDEEMAGDYLPALGNPELTIEVIGNIYENPELI